MKNKLFKPFAFILVCSIILSLPISAHAYNIGNYTMFGHNAITSAYISLWTNQNNEHELHGEMYGVMDKPISMSIGFKGAIILSTGSRSYFDDLYPAVSSPDGSVISDSHWRSPNFTVKDILEAKYSCTATDYLDCIYRSERNVPWTFG